MGTFLEHIYNILAGTVYSLKYTIEYEYGNSGPWYLSKYHGIIRTGSVQSCYSETINNILMNIDMTYEHYCVNCVY